MSLLYPSYFQLFGPQREPAALVIPCPASCIPLPFVHHAPSIVLMAAGSAAGTSRPRHPLSGLVQTAAVRASCPIHRTYGCGVRSGSQQPASSLIRPRAYRRYARTARESAVSLIPYTASCIPQLCAHNSFIHPAYGYSHRGFIHLAYGSVLRSGKPATSVISFPASCNPQLCARHASSNLLMPAGSAAGASRQHHPLPRLMYAAVLLFILALSTLLTATRTAASSILLTTARTAISQSHWPPSDPRGLVRLDESPSLRRDATL